MDIIVAGVGGGLVVLALVYQLAVASPRNKRMAREAEAAPPAVAFMPTEIAGLESGVALAKRFDALRTFGDVADWDRQATELLGSLEAAAEQLDAGIATAREELNGYVESTTDAPHIKTARVGKSERALSVAEKLLRGAAELHELLLERIDMTPDNPKEQRSLLKSLKAERKELQIRKKETRAAMTAVRREARIAHVDAAPSAWAGRYSRKLAAQERRSIRREKESALAPHEDEMAALDRQLVTLERRIAWVERFGEDDDS